MTVQKYRKKPVEIEAMRFGTIQDGSAIAEWSGGSNEISPEQVQIKTLEGTMTAVLGDFVIRGVQGEFYPCKPDIFAATYEAVQAPINRGPWVRRGTLPPVGSKLVAGNTGKVIYEVVEHDDKGWRRDRVRLRDTRNGRSAGWEVAHYYRYLIEENNA